MFVSLSCLSVKLSLSLISMTLSNSKLSTLYLKLHHRFMIFNFINKLPQKHIYKTIKHQITGYSIYFCTFINLFSSDRKSTIHVLTQMTLWSQMNSQSILSSHKQLCPPAQQTMDTNVCCLVSININVYICVTGQYHVLYLGFISVLCVVFIFSFKIEFDLYIKN